MRRRDLLPGLLLTPWWLASGWPLAAAAQSAELLTLALHRDDGALTLEFSTRLDLPRAVEDALQRGVPVYFVAEATLYRRRWYWRDDRVARVRRTWRLAFQPLTATWRVGQGALTQTYDTLNDALATLSGTGRWRVADLADLDPDSRHYVDFSYRLDTTQLPSPLQISLSGQSDWLLRIERELVVP